MAASPSASPHGFVGPYWYENLGEDDFQKLCHVLISSRFDKVTCYPVGQKDGGRDIKRRDVSGDVVYQVKWSKSAVKNPLTWLTQAVEGEAVKIAALAKAGVKRYILMTSVSGTAAAATGPNGFGAGTIDKLDTALEDYAEAYGLESMECWWRDDIDALVTRQPGSTHFRFSKMLAGAEAMRFLIQADQSEAAEAALVSLTRRAVQAQWWQDVKVKFKQAELDKDDLEDLFVDVKTWPNPKRRTDNLILVHSGAKPVGAVEYLNHSQAPFTLVLGEPGQGKSTLAQYLSQIYRSPLVPDEPGTKLKRPAMKPAHDRVPLRIDLRDYGAWLDGLDPFAESNSVSKAKPKIRRHGAVERFLVALLAWLTESDQVELATVQDLLDRFPVLLVFDGLDEVAQRETRQRVVNEIHKFIGRWRGGSTVPPKIVVTTRPNVSNLPEPSPDYFEPITLLKLDHQLRLTYLRRWCKARGIVNRDRRNLIHSFDTRTAEPHIAQLAENPMQLTILLYLLHLQGHSVPDKRTALYDDYMKTFLNREAEKSVSVRDNRDTLEEVTAYLGWYLQGLAEQHGGSGRLGIVAIKTEIFRYLTVAQKDTALVEALFTDVTDRVWALASKSQGAFEFDVLPVREFFAAKFLSQYASADKADILKALVRRQFWFNTSRFFAGFAHANELGGLVDGLQEEFGEARHPLSARVATWTLLADGVFSSKTTAQRRAVELLGDDLGVRLLLAECRSTEGLPVLPVDRGAQTIEDELLAEISAQPASPLSLERFVLATFLAKDETTLGQWWLDQIGPAIGTPDELSWLRLGAVVTGARQLSAEQLDKLTLSGPKAICASLAAGLGPPPNSSIEQSFMSALLAGQCSDVYSPRTGLVPDIANALAPREFISLAVRHPTNLFTVHTAHCEKLMPDLKRRDAFRRLRKQNASFGEIQRIMNIVRRSPNTVRPWSDVAEQLRSIYGPSWLSADIAIVGAAIDPNIRRDVGPMNPQRSTFGPEIDYGKLVNDIRRNRNKLQWWLEQRTALTGSDRAVWIYALIAVAKSEVIQECLSELVDDVNKLDTDQLFTLMQSSSRLGASQVSRRLPVELANFAFDLSPRVGLMVTHHLDVEQLRPGILTGLTLDRAIEAAKYGPASWPAMQTTGYYLQAQDAPDWLPALAAFGPSARGGLALGLLPEQASAEILGNPDCYPLKWLEVAEKSHSRCNAEPPLLTAADAWFDDH